jgi:hypothetical protein
MSVRNWIVALAIGVLAPAAASASDLDVVNVAAPAINCVFNAACKVTVFDTYSSFTPNGDSGEARLQSRSFAAEPPAPLAGKMAYLYRVDLTGVTAPAATNCVTAVQFVFGPITKGPFAPGSPPKDLFVVTSGGLGSVSVANATAAGNIVTVNFPARGVCPGQTSYFFGLVSATTVPVNATARIFYGSGESATTAIRVP